MWVAYIRDSFFSRRAKNYFDKHIPMQQKGMLRAAYTGTAGTAIIYSLQQPAVRSSLSQLRKNGGRASSLGLFPPPPNHFQEGMMFNTSPGNQWGGGGIIPP